MPRLKRTNPAAFCRCVRIWKRLLFRKGMRKLNALYRPVIETVVALLRRIVERKRIYIHRFYILTAIVTISLPFLIHDESPTCSWLCAIKVIHRDFFSVALYKPGSYRLSMGFDRFRIWEFFAIIQAALFSILLVFEPDKKNISRLFMFIYSSIVALCLFAILCLGVLEEAWYQRLIIGILFIFWGGDSYMWWKTKETTYKLVWFFVDFPIVIAVVLVNWYVGIPLKEADAPFYSGTIAFQLMLGNFLIFMIRSHDKIQDNSSIGKTFFQVFKSK